MRGILNDMHKRAPQTTLVFGDKTHSVLSVLAQGTFCRQRMMSIVAQISKERDQASGAIFDHFQVLLTIFANNYNSAYAGQSIPLTELLALLHAYGLQRMVPNRGDFIGMASPILEFFEATQKLQYASNLFYQALNEMRLVN